MSLLTLFYVEQAVLFGLACVGVTLFFLQMQSEQFQHEALSRVSVKYQFHRLGLVCGGLLLAATIDPFGVHGIFGPIAPAVLLFNIYALFVVMYIIMNYTTLSVSFKAAFRRTPRWLTMLGVFLIASTFVVVDTPVAWGYVNDKWWLSSIALFWCGIMLGILTLSLLIVTQRMVRHMRHWQEQRSRDNSESRNSRSGSASSNSATRMSRSSSEQRIQARERRQRGRLMWQSFLVTTIGVAVSLILFATAYFRLKDSETEVPPADLDKFNLRDRVLLYTSYFPLALMLWIAWIPLRFGPYEELETRESRPSMSGSWKSRSHSRVAATINARSRLSQDGPGLLEDGMDTMSHHRDSYGGQAD